MAPEYVRFGEFSVKSDVFSFGDYKWPESLSRSSWAEFEGFT